jgi:hypothetical protein
MERLVEVQFGPSPSKRFGKAVAQAQRGPGECTQIEPGRYRVRFPLGSDAAIYSGLGRLLERVRQWRATDVYAGEELLSTFHTTEMAWCASFYLESFGACRERFLRGVLPRCALCPLFDPERAIRAGGRETPASGECHKALFRLDDVELIPEPDFTIVTDLDFLFNPDLLTQLNGEIPDWMDLSGLVPDFPPEERGDPADDEGGS